MVFRRPLSYAGWRGFSSACSRSSTPLDGLCVQALPWSMLPNDFLPWEAVYQQTQRWLAAGCFERWSMISGRSCA